MGSPIQPEVNPLPNLLVRPSKLVDCESVADNIRPADRREVAAHLGLSPYDSLRGGVAISRPCYTVELSGEPIAIFGVAPALDEKVGIVWLLGTPKIETISTQFLRHSRKWLAFVGRDYEVLTNFIDARNTVHLRWLKWLGFSFVSRRAQHGVEKRPFYEFVRIL
jgi:hypothetical protein